jgi:hypothetical protein
VIKDVRDKKIFFVNPEELVNGDPFIARITLKALVDDKTGRAFDTQSKWYKGFS